MGKATRAAFGDALLRIGATHPKVVVLDADLASSVQTKKFGDAYPDRFLQVGIAEANMVGIAAGLALGGYDRRILGWLAGWDVPTIGGVVSLLHRARAATPLSAIK